MPNQSLRQLAGMVRRGLFCFVGEPGASANYVHLASVIEALLRCGTLPEAIGRIYNLSDWRTMEQFVAAIAAALGRPTPRRRIPERVALAIGRVGDRVPRFPLTSARVMALSSRAWYPTRRIESELGFYHPHTMERAIERVVRAWWG
jgi:nucleoside-diphosphate-sugar epimerase